MQYIIISKIKLVITKTKQRKMSKFKKTNFKKAVKSNVEKQDRAESNYGYLNIPKGTPMYKTKEGKVYIDIIPYVVTNPRHMDRQDDIAEPGSLWYRSAFKVHRNVGVNNDTVICPAAFGKPCPICEYRNKRIAEKADKEETKALYASLRSLYAVIPINDKDQKEVVHIWDVSDHLFQKKLNAELKEDEAFSNFPALEDGYTLRIRFEEQKIGKNTFNETTRIDFEEREAYDDSIIDDVPDLDKMLTVLTYKELEAMFHEIEPEDVSDETVEEVEEKPVRRKRPAPVAEEEEDEPKPVRRKKPVVEEEEEEDEKPVRRKPAPVVEEEEEEPEEKPTKPARKTPPAPAKGKCPHGHKFGVDVDQMDECNDCNDWDACIEAASN